MGDIRLFSLKSPTIHEIEISSINIEKSLQNLIEKNMETLLGVRFLSSEYSTGKTHGGRIDSLGIDENKLPEELEEIISKQSYVVEKKVKLTYDGRQFIIGIPKEISKERGITTENQIVFRLIKPRPDSQDALKLEIELV